MGNVAVHLPRLLRPGLSALAAAGLVIGTLSAASPQRSIALYEWIMERFNWRVSPIDEALELRNTRLLGVVLCGLSLVILRHATRMAGE